MEDREFEKKRCEMLKKHAFSNCNRVIWMLDAMKAKGCTFPENAVTCIPCDDTLQARYIIGDEDGQGGSVWY